MPLAFSLILTVSSTLLHIYSTDDRISGLMLKRFSTMGGHPERFTELHGEEEKEEGGRDEQEEKGGVKRGREHASQ